jgi:serine phosphatase RsbU (regulator of sigma subunit)
MSEQLNSNFKNNIKNNFKNDIKKDTEQDLKQEIKNFQDIASTHMPQPGDTPQLAGIDIYGESLPLGDVVGGDHIIYIDFNRRFDLDRRIGEATAEELKAKLRRNKTRAGILLADVSGHQTTDATLHIGFHHAFLLGVIYELDINGEVTTRLFENLNTRFFKTANFAKYITMIYGEIDESGDFIFLSAGHPHPVVYSREYDQIVDILPDRLITFYPIGMFPSDEDVDRSKVSPEFIGKKKYTVNHIKLLRPGDILVLYTDGLQDHERDGVSYFPDRLQDILRHTRDLSAREIFDIIRKDLYDFAPPRDDISLVVVKRS